MYALGIPVSQYRRTTQVLGHESSYPIAYEDEKQDDDFYLFKFPNIDEYDFRKIVILLKQNGITTISRFNKKNLIGYKKQVILEMRKCTEYLMTVSVWY